MTKERRLGCGLEALLGRPTEPIEDRLGDRGPAPIESSVFPSSDTPTKAGVYDIDSNPFQPRRDFTEQDIQELADSIETHGMLQPLVIRRVEQRAPACRWRATLASRDQGWLDGGSGPDSKG